MEPPSETVMDYIKNSGIKVTGIGKIEDIFAGRGLTVSFHTRNNSDGMNLLMRELKKRKEGFIFINLVDFDMRFGHRRNISGYSKALEMFDIELGLLLKELSADDLLIITADHGCDPGFMGTDHTREYVPLLVLGKNIIQKNLGIRLTFSDIGVSIIDYFDFEGIRFPGQSFLFN